MKQFSAWKKKQMNKMVAQREGLGCGDEVSSPKGGGSIFRTLFGRKASLGYLGVCRMHRFRTRDHGMRQCASHTETVNGAASGSPEREDQEPHGPSHGDGSG